MARLISIQPIRLGEPMRTDTQKLAYRRWIASWVLCRLTARAGRRKERITMRAYQQHNWRQLYAGDLLDD